MPLKEELVECLVEIIGEENCGARTAELYLFSLAHGKTLGIGVKGFTCKEKGSYH